MINNICVAGAGTMGRGIALTAALNNFSTILFDTNPAVIETAKKAIGHDLAFLLDKKKITESEKLQVDNSIKFTTIINECAADLIIEAIIEDPAAKLNLFKQLEEINKPTTIFASNTSSLSITSLQLEISNPGRVAGLHFFNPAHVMKLVEIIKGEHTDPEVITALQQLCGRLKKTAVLCKDSPGFIVNRVARHYYLEAMNCAEKNISSFSNIDKIMESTGFRMGPFRLMDLIGMDINLAVSQSIYHAFDDAPRFKPSQLQMEKVQQGELGKKSGKGFYDY